MALINVKNRAVWKASLSLIKEVKTLTNTFPKEEKFALVSQMNRDARAISANLIEAGIHEIAVERSAYLTKAINANLNLLAQNILAERLGYITTAEVEINEKKLATILTMLRAFGK